MSTSSHLRRSRAFATTLVLSLLFSVAVLPPASAQTTFRDSGNSPFAHNIQWVAEQGISIGCNPPANDRFCPARAVTRGQMAAFLVRTLGISRTSGATFSDVPAGSTFARDIDILATAGITRGVGGDRFAPRDPVDRGQMAAFLVRAFELDERSGVRFPDVPQDSTFARDIDALATAGITRGTGDGRYRPHRTVTRAETAAFLHRAVEPETASIGSVSGATRSASNTGFRAAGLSTSDLRTIDGGLTTTSHGQVIDRVDVTGGIRIAHRDVTIRNSRVRHSGGYGITHAASNIGTVRIENVEVDGRGVADGIGIYIEAPVRVSRANIHGQRVGMQIHSGSTIESSYIHDQAVASGTHNTAMSSHGATDLTIVGNRLESSTSASLSLYPRLAPIRDVEVRGNLFEGGGRGIGLYAGYTSNHPHRDGNRNIRIIGNRWTGSFQHGTHLAYNGNQPGNTWTDNAWLDGRRIG